MERLRVVSLFSGAGGLDLGFVQTGRYEVLFANDILFHAVQTYSRNIGLKLAVCRGGERAEAEKGVALACDVAQVDFSGLSDLEVDVVVGGPPCQDFSIIRGPSNKRRGIKVQRGRLYAHFVRALIYLQPKAFVFENVPGLISANGGLAYKVIIEDLSRLETMWEEVKKTIKANNIVDRVYGYELVFSDVIDMTRLGLPQKRERLIVIGVRRDLAERLGVRSFSPSFYKLKAVISSRLKGVKSVFAKFPLTPIEVFEGDVLPNLQEKYKAVMEEYRGVWGEVGTPKAWRWKREVWDKLTLDAVKDYVRLNGVKHYREEELDEAFDRHRELLAELGYYGRSVKSLSPPDGSNRVPKESPAVIERLKHIPPGENHEFVRGTKWGVKGLMSNMYRRVHPLLPAPTVIAYGGGGTWGYHYERGRGMLTNRERARLQSFPDSFLFIGTWSQVRAQIGEAVPPLIAKRVAEALAEALDMTASY